MSTAPAVRRKLHKLPNWSRVLFQPKRYKGIKGGRGGGKSHTVMEAIILLALRNPNLSVVFIREVQKSLKDSVKRLLEDKIRDMGLGKYFESVTTEIRCTKGTGRFLFIGMTDHTNVTIKSLEGMDIAVIEEAQTISKPSLKILKPTIRKENSEIWFLWNPQHETDPVDVFFADLAKDPAEADSYVLVHVSYTTNRHASEAMRREAERDYRMDPATADHVWGGDYEKNSEARIFKHVRVENFETPKDAILRFGLDWGFSVDPLAGVRGFLGDEPDTLYIDYEIYEVGVQIRDTKHYLMKIPGAERYVWTAGKDRPERIADAILQGIKMKACIGGNNSKIQAVEHLANYTIIIHTRCPRAAQAFRNYKHPIDKHTGQIIPILPTKKDDMVEAACYMMEDVRRFEQGRKKPKPKAPMSIVNRWAGGYRG